MSIWRAKTKSGLGQLARRSTLLVAGTVPNESKSVIDAKSIAVLPFENRSEEKQNEYFADGVQDEILTYLAKDRRLESHQPHLRDAV